MILSAAITAVRERLDEADSAGWSDVEIRRWINEGVTDIARKTETCCRPRPTIDVDAGDAEHTLPSNVLRVYRATYTEDGNDHIYPLEYMDFNAADSMWWTNMATTEARPRIFTLWGYPPTLSRPKLYPVPSIAGTLTVYYYANSTPLSHQTAPTDASSNWWCGRGYMDLDPRVRHLSMALRRDRDPRWKEHKADLRRGPVHDDRDDPQVVRSGGNGVEGRDGSTELAGRRGLVAGFGGGWVVSSTLWPASSIPSLHASGQ
jgi:hypothetical protein